MNISFVFFLCTNNEFSPRPVCRIASCPSRSVSASKRRPGCWRVSSILTLSVSTTPGRGRAKERNALFWSLSSWHLERLKRECTGEENVYSAMPFWQPNYKQHHYNNSYSAFCCHIKIPLTKAPAMSSILSKCSFLLLLLFFFKPFKLPFHWWVVANLRPSRIPALTCSCSCIGQPLIICTVCSICVCVCSIYSTQITLLLLG